MEDISNIEMAFSDKELLYLLGMLTEPENYDVYDIAEQVKIKSFQYGYEIFKRYNEILSKEEVPVFLKTVERVEKALGKKILQQN